MSEKPGHWCDSGHMARSDTPETDEAQHPVNLEISQIVVELRQVLGAKLVAYLGNVKETQRIRFWAEGSLPVGQETEQRLRLAFQISLIVSDVNQVRIVQAWFQRLHPQLSDRSPARLIREFDPNEVAADLLSAARAFAR